MIGFSQWLINRRGWADSSAYSAASRVNRVQREGVRLDHVLAARTLDEFIRVRSEAVSPNIDVQRSTRTALRLAQAFVQSKRQD